MQEEKSHKKRLSQKPLKQTVAVINVQNLQQLHYILELDEILRIMPDTPR